MSADPVSTSQPDRLSAALAGRYRIERFVQQIKTMAAGATNFVTS